MSVTGSALALTWTNPEHVLDALDTERLLVIGSLPPEGRDLDVAVRRRDSEAVDSALISHGFTRRGVRYVRFVRSTAQVVEVSILEDWDLPEVEIHALLDQARPLPAMRRLSRPSPTHVLLLLAPLCVRTGELTPRRRLRLEAALREEPSAWEKAALRAPAWRAGLALGALRQLAEGRSLSLFERIEALAQPRRMAGTSRSRAAVGAARRVAPRGRCGAVVTFSGVDGAGKSSQAAALAEALQQLGEDPVVVWSRVRYDPLLAVIGRMAKRLLAPLGAAHSGTVALRSALDDAGEQPPGPTGRAAPRRVLDIGWAYVCAAVDGYRHVALCVPGLARGRIVICDRYTLDTHVHLRERFHSHPVAVRGAARLGRWISPSPLRSFWLDIPSGQAWLRKPDDVDRSRLAAHARSYAELHRGHQVLRLDARQPVDEIAAKVATAIWSARSDDSRRTIRRPSRQHVASATPTEGSD